MQSYVDHRKLEKYSYSAQPVWTPSGIRCFPRKERPDWCFGCEYPIYGHAIVLVDDWFAKHKSRGDGKMVLREPSSAHNCGMMASTAQSALFGAGCSGNLDGRKDLYIVHGDPSGERLERFLYLGYDLLWDGDGEYTDSIVPFDSVTFDVYDEMAYGAKYTGSLDDIADAVAFQMGNAAKTTLRESLLLLVRFLEYGRTRSWRYGVTVPDIPMSTMSLGYLDDTPVPEGAEASADDQIAFQALEYASEQSLDECPKLDAPRRTFDSAYAFGRIWEDIVRNADKRDRSEHLYEIFAKALAERGVDEDTIGEEWMTVAVESVGHALGVDYAFESYLSGVALEHILEGF